MPFSGTGIFNRIYQWVNDAANDLDVSSTRMDTDSNDIADGLSNCVTRDGQSPALANLPMGGFKFTELATGSALTDSVNYGQVFNNPTFNSMVGLGTVNFAGAGTVTVPTAAPGDNTTKAASTAFATQLAFSAALPAQSLGFLSSTGAVASFTKNLTFGLNEAKAANVASATSPDIWAGNGNTLHITGTTTLTGFAAAPQAGAWRKLVFDGACLLTNSANFVVQGNADYTTSANDVVFVFADTTTKFYLLILKANGDPVVRRTQTGICTADLTKTSDTALANVSGLVATLVSGATYRFEVVAFTDSANNGGVKFGFSGTATATSFIAAMLISTTGGTASTYRVTSIASTLSSNNATGLITTINGTIVCNTSGTLQIQFAQELSLATPSVVKVNSTFTVERIS